MSLKLTGPGTGVRNDPEVVADRKYRIERSQCVCRRVIPAGDIGLQAEPRLEPPGWNRVAGVRCKGPGADVC